jgi:cellulose synthase/poly-beta-1,6-N-acetylglucosamine synthase-like glycosyltransferase
MKVSIVINNYNYARYVGDAIDSALAQTWQPLEVVVVDDGSIDDSWSVIQRYGARIHAVRQPNGGQGAAYNAGFAASRGQWVLFLDADDLLDADALERMMALAAADVAKVQGRLRCISADGRPLGGEVPYMTHDGDVTPVARRFRHYASPPSSGNLYRRSAIDPYLPMPPEDWRYGADTVTIVLSAFHGRVATVQGPIGSYRLHSSGKSRAGVLGNVNRSLAHALQRSEGRRRNIEAWGSQCKGIDWSNEHLTLPWDWRARALSWRLHPEDHPYPLDDRHSIARGLDRTLAAWPGYTVVERLLQRAWLRFMLIAPRGFVTAFASSNAPGGWRSRIKFLRRVKAS